ALLSVPTRRSSDLRAACGVATRAAARLVATAIQRRRARGTQAIMRPIQAGWRTAGQEPRTSLFASRRVASGGCSADPAPRVREEPEPGGTIAPRFGSEGELNAAERALGVRHEDRRAPIRRGQRRDAAGRAVRILRIVLGDAPAMIDIAQRDEAALFARRAVRRVGE